MNYLGEISALLTACLWSATSVIFSEAAKKIGSMQLNINRLIFATIYLLITILAFQLPYNLSSNQIALLAMSGMIGLVFGDSFLFHSYLHIGARLSMLLMSASPAMSSLLAYIFLGEEISFIGIVGIFVTITGIALVVLQRQEIPTSHYKISKIGILFGLFAALGQAGGLIFAKLAFQESEVNGFTATFFRIFPSVLVLLPIGIITKKYTNPVKLFKENVSAFKLTLAGTLVGPYLGITFSLIAVANTSVGIAATLMATVPIIMLPVSKFIYKEKLSPQAIAGTIMAVAGVAMLFLKV